ncbi:MAG: acyl-CoA thioesterase [Gemmobacter sp.]|uniref:acyl-CoA thioesterase n=1 Tax=Gemmobacter sp. TaxID=1898957 RepID=UPI003919A9F5
MYPFARLAIGLFAATRQPRLGPFDPHVSRHVCWPWDLDPWRELNNGRTLTLYDLGRTPLAVRSGLTRALGANGWGMTVAGSSVRYRRRVRMFDRVTMVSRLLGWDARFLYLDQSMWLHGECTSQALIRSAVTSRAGIVPPAEVARALGHSGPGPALPDWVRAWTEAEAQRPWPPEAGKFLPR